MKGLIHISWGGPTCRIKDTNGKVWRFEDHPYFGPNVETSTGEIAARQPRERSPFWPAVEAWYAQGKKVDAEGLCVWAPPPQLVLEHMSGNHYKVIGYK